MLLPTIIVCLVGTTFACSEYGNATVQFDDSYVDLKNELTFETPTEYNIGYVSLLLSAVGMAYGMIDGLSYDDAYAQWPGLLVIGQEFPTQAQDMLSTKLEEAVQATLSIRKLVNETCGSEISADCDCKIEEAIKDDAKLQAQAEFLLAEYASEWPSYQSEWIEAAQNNTVKEYLTSQKERMQAIIEAKQGQFSMMEDIDKNGYSG